MAVVDFFPVPGFEAWQPKYVEVMLWDYSYAPEKSVPWPKNWPALGSPRALKRRENYSIFMNGTQLPQINGFLARNKGTRDGEVGRQEMGDGMSPDLSRRTHLENRFEPHRAWRLNGSGRLPTRC